MDTGVVVVSEDTTGLPDEGYVKFVRELIAAIRPHRPVIELMIPAESASKRLGGMLRRCQRLREAARSPDVQGRPGAAMIYVSRSSCTVCALLRARVLKLSARRLTVAMVGLQPRKLSGFQNLVAQALWPDLLLVGTSGERDLYRQRGARAEVITGGVDLSRFRPAVAGEKEALRAKWGVPADKHIVLHVGHATTGRNLQALSPLASAPGIAVMAVLSSRPGQGATPLLEKLEQNGVLVLAGYLPDVEELYRLSDCYVFPTLSTDHALALPLSVIEALASGLPVVSVPVGALPERFSGQPGVRFASAGELQTAVSAQLKDRPPTRHLAEPYSWRAQADRLLRMLDGTREPDIASANSNG